MESNLEHIQFAHCSSLSACEYIPEECEQISVTLKKIKHICRSGCDSIFRAMELKWRVVLEASCESGLRRPRTSALNSR